MPVAVDLPHTSGRQMIIEEVLKFLVDHGANVNPMAKEEKTPPGNASEAGYEAIVRLLKSTGLKKT